MRNYRDFGVCEICGDKVEKKYLLQSSDNIFYCKECFKKRFSSGDQRHYLKKFVRKSQKLIPYPEMYSVQRNSKNAKMNNRPSSTISVVSLSKRPLQCPKPECSKFVSLFTLESHFKYEHKEVPIILTQLDARSALEFYPKDVRYGITQCIVLLNVINHDFSSILPRHISSYCSKTNLQTLDSRPVMFLLATRIAGCHLAKEQEHEPPACDSEDDVESSRTYTEHDLLFPDDKIIIWMASNISTNLSYTIAASTLSNKIRQKYFGPMMTLSDSAIELCNEGNCLILTHFHINGMSENGFKPLALDVVIHSPD
ncbi:hypothetical protein NQ315_008037 [Exocentrus adspersus]|uniref:DUF4729 domain-containing protein n=1 Tax=Exocentrus adspersus TaxID=1586481 RepID=A0AAV8VWG2_9CUCU|nr:hypothetical protein NQ315_008037 [Exocentrus adspersus]